MGRDGGDANGMSFAMNAVVFGRDQELADLRQRLRERRWLVLFGASGMGKTHLLRTVLPEFPGALYCSPAPSRDAVFAALAGCLRARGGGSACALRGRVRSVLMAQPGRHVIVLDHLRRPSAVFAAALQDLCRLTDTPLIVLSRSPHMEDLGGLYACFPDRDDRLQLGPLAPTDAEAMAAWLQLEEPLDAINVEAFRRQAVAAAGGNPGVLRHLWSLAAEPRYRSRGHILFSPLYIDHRLGATPWRAARA
jgi:hypothetical protein